MSVVLLNGLVVWLPMLVGLVEMNKIDVALSGSLIWGEHKK
jgi:hypothetical protein